MTRRRAALALALAAALAGWAGAPRTAFAQFTLPKGTGSLTLAGQYIENIGHRDATGFLTRSGQSVNASATLELEYGITDRLSAGLALPYVLARYTGALPSFRRLPVDECQCWNSAFQDLGLSVRYRLGTDAWAVTPAARLVRPTHDYSFRGEAAVGMNLDEVHLGVALGRKLDGVIPGASVHAEYDYAFVEKPVADVRLNRSATSVGLGIAVTDRLFVRVGANWARVHGGLSPYLGEINTPERMANGERLFRANYWQLGGGVSYAVGPVDLFAGVSGYMRGKNSHAGQIYNLGASWYFEP